jgi:hypothetical protein
MRLLFEHCPVDVGCPQDPGAGGEHAGRQGAMVAAPVEAFLCRTGELGQRLKHGRVVEHSLCEMGIKLNALALGAGQPSPLFPDGIRDADPTQAVHETRLVDEGNLRAVQAHAGRRRLSQLGHVGTVAQSED